MIVHVVVLEVLSVQSSLKDGYDDEAWFMGLRARTWIASLIHGRLPWCALGPRAQVRPCHDGTLPHLLPYYRLDRVDVAWQFPQL